MMAYLFTFIKNYFIFPLYFKVALFWWATKLELTLPMN